MKIWKTIFGLAVAVYFAFNPLQAEDVGKTKDVKKPTVKVQQTEIITPDAIRSRTEILTKLREDLDLYANFQYDLLKNQKSTNFARLRSHYAPLRSGPFSFGGTFNYVKLPNGVELKDYGPVGRLFHKGENCFIKHDQRCFIPSSSIDSFTVFGYKKFSAEALMRFGLKTKSGFVRSGAGYDITDNLNVGIETRNNIKDGKGKCGYLGFRLRFKF
tara:strand:- start:2016 stop:2660 length:645 start_codon:yes stop_codon:yes gene_type:complete